MQTVVNGYDVTILIDLCKTIIRAHEEGKLLKRQESIVRQAHIILNASAKAGIKGLVYALAGYDASFCNRPFDTLAVAAGVRLAMVSFFRL